MNDYLNASFQTVARPGSSLSHASEMTAFPTQKIRLDLAIDGNTLLGSLSDGGGLLLVGEVPDLNQRLEQLESVWANHQWPNLTTGIAMPDQGDLAWLHTFGSELFCQLLPGRIQAFFRQTLPCHLHITADCKLAGVPWECAFDGLHHWQDFHAVSRAILGHQGVAESDLIQNIRPVHQLATRVLLDCKGLAGQKWHHYQRDLFQVLTAQAGLAVWQDEWPYSGPGGWDIMHVASTPGNFLRRLQNGTDFASQIAKSHRLILDWCPSNGDEDSWQKEGEAVAMALTRLARLVCIKRTVKTPPEPFFALTVYNAMADAVATARDHDVPKLPSSITFSRYGDDVVRALLPPNETETQRSFRQVTALSYDLVDSTLLQRHMGMEQYSVCLREYHRRFGEVITRWGGFFRPAKSDDGSMCYFGAHHTHEDTIRRALYAAHELVTQAQSMNLRVRFGMATGQAAVQDEHVNGDSINLAARIQSLAPAGTILISESTAKLARPYFVVQAFPHEQQLKGFPKPNRLFSLGPEKPAGSAGFDAGLNSALLHGRHVEMEKLSSEWAMTQQRQSRWLHVTGEAGIGKSRLVATFINYAQQQGDVKTITCRCYAETSGRAFGPIIEMLERWFQIGSNDDEKTRVSKLTQSANEFNVLPEYHLAVSYLLGLPAPKTQLPQQSDPQAPRRKFLMRTMSAWLLNQAKNYRLCFVLEDLQWADPSTLDYLRRLKSDSTGHKFMAILTERTEQHPAALSPMADEAIALGRLSSSAVHEMIATLTAGRTVSRQMAETIEAKSDGVPLFVEMSTRMVLENLHEANSTERGNSSQDFPIPATLRDLLMQRLDNLGTARTLAQLCSAIGREFSRHLLLTLCEANVANIQGEVVQRHLSTLLRSGLLLESNEDDYANLHYHFRHALVHEAAYQSMWETDRRRLHESIAKAIETRLPDMSLSHPEVLAHHYEACGSLADGAKWHWLAARKSKSNEAHTESLAHLARAKLLLKQLPVTPQCVKSELDIELTMAGQLIATKGYGAPSVGQCYLAALTHANALNDKKSILRAQLGLEAYHLMRADFGQAHAYLTQAQNTAKNFADPLTQAQCLFALANILHHQGHAKGMQDLCNQCLEVCRSSKLQGKLVQSPEVMSLMYSAICAWEMGHVDLALARGQEGLDIAKELGQRLGLGQALGLQAMLLLLCGELELAAKLSEQAISVCEAGDHEMWVAHARIIFGCCVSELGDPHRGGDLMDLGYAQWIATGTVITRTFYLALRAPTCALLGKIDEALAQINEACRIIVKHGERYYEPEVLRIKAELLLQQKSSGAANNEALADALFSQAKESAMELGFPSLALRVAISMARRCREKANTANAADIVQGALAALKEGHDTRDQRLARSLLAKWRDESARLQ